MNQIVASSMYMIEIVVKYPIMPIIINENTPKMIVVINEHVVLAFRNFFPYTSIKFID